MTKTLAPIRKVLRSISVGQYRTTLYFKGSHSYSSSFGGLVTIILAIVLLSISLNLLSNCFKRTKWVANVEKIRFEDWEYRNSTLQELVDLGMKLPSYNYMYTGSVSSDQFPVVNWTKWDFESCPLNTLIEEI